jgi:hypothetical protein
MNDKMKMGEQSSDDAELLRALVATTADWLKHNEHDSLDELRRAFEGALVEEFIRHREMIWASAMQLYLTTP